MKIKDKTFTPLLPAEEIAAKVNTLARQINKDYKGTKPLFIAILNGSFIFAADLLKEIDLECEVSFVKLSSYSEMTSSGTVKELIGINENIFNRDVIIIEDIVDTGNTMRVVLDEFRDRGVKSVEIVSLLVKPEALVNSIDIKYVGFEIPNKFVVGYGLDYDGFGRNTKAIYQIKA
ncbi:MAG: hypoxanthine phosphoribosyltransferase [Cyclobacteriaceae bacterium]|nr:hypoxanthine phosphoribosyltransferase [Cyclobacteriaceae bacterium]